MNDEQAEYFLWFSRILITIVVVYYRFKSSFELGRRETDREIDVEIWKGEEGF
jgi:hypothetical protein